MNPFDFVSYKPKPYDQAHIDDCWRDHPLPAALAVAVPFRILQFREAGGPLDRDWESLNIVSQRIAEHGDTLLYGSKKKGEAARLFCDLVDALAIMAFVPGGVYVFGDHYEVKPEGG